VIKVNTRLAIIVAGLFAGLTTPTMAATPAPVQTVNGLTASDFDITTTPPNVMTDKAATEYWSMPQHDKKCFVYRKEYGAPLTMQLQLQPPATFARAPQSIFPPAEPLPACVPQGIQTARLAEQVTNFDPPTPLKPFDAKTVAEYAHSYGHHDTEAATDFAGYWFATTLAHYRAFNDPADSRALIDTLLAWNKAGAFTKNIQIAGNSGTVIYSISTNMAALIAAYADLAPVMTAEERQQLGPWFNSFMHKLAANADQFRTQDHEMGFGLLLAEWGLAVGDKAAVQHAIDRYKYAINDMRPDGVFMQDSSRGGSGLNYQNLMTSDAVLLAALLKTDLGLDLFSYSVQGRSIEDAIGYNLAAMADPVAFNKRNALPCPDASTQTVDNPVTDFSDLGDTFSTSIYLPVFALLNPESKYAGPIMDRFGEKALHQAYFQEVIGGAPICLLSLKPPGFSDVAKPTPAVSTEELKSYSDGLAPDFNAIWNSFVQRSSDGQHEFNYNVSGSYSSGLDTIGVLQFVANAPIGKSEPPGLSHCGSGEHTVTYDDGQKRVLLNFLRIGGDFEAQNVKCILAALPKGDAASTVVFLTTRFRDVAAGLVESGDVNNIRNDHLRKWIADVAAGKVTVH